MHEVTVIKLAVLPYGVNLNNTVFCDYE